MLRQLPSGRIAGAAMKPNELNHALAFLGITKERFLSETRISHHSVKTRVPAWVVREVKERLLDAGKLEAFRHYLENGGATGPAMFMRPTGPTRQSSAEIERRRLSAALPCSSTSR